MPIARGSFREARARAAVELLSYLRDPCPATERSLLDATHDLEVAAVRRRLSAVSQRQRAALLRQLTISH